MVITHEIPCYRLCGYNMDLMILWKCVLLCYVYLMMLLEIYVYAILEMIVICEG